ncbi:hypothetical protein F503_07430 [Ophiostoma piceae UAMH 11346]|uniref:Uncharacterized protein n=1 Tax=Ophiostoma piceae (strain UAMH 11346) TaxID=1262450 RepID=S3C812_OPHP1|nr:hypothetical protein F503_07430 [Ophiostoma piceae UAMH 11346]
MEKDMEKYRRGSYMETRVKLRPEAEISTKKVKTDELERLAGGRAGLLCVGGKRADATTHGRWTFGGEDGALGVRGSCCMRLGEDGENEEDEEDEEDAEDEEDERA